MRPIIQRASSSTGRCERSPTGSISTQTQTWWSVWKSCWNADTNWPNWWATSPTDTEPWRERWPKHQVSESPACITSWSFSFDWLKTSRRWSFTWSTFIFMTLCRDGDELPPVVNRQAVRQVQSPPKSVCETHSHPTSVWGPLNTAWGPYFPEWCTHALTLMDALIGSCHV